MKAVILAGGYGTRLSEETSVKPKPMIEIGGKPILWHIMKIYSFYNVNEFIICCGYKGYAIKEYFANYFFHNSDVTIDLANNAIDIHQTNSESWKVTLIDTGENSGTGGRLKYVQPFVGEDDFCFTYGDGVSDVHIEDLIAFHKKHEKLVTLTAIQPSSKYGVLTLEGTNVIGFKEKPNGEGGWINGGFFVLSPKVIDFIDNYDEHWEHAPMRRLVEASQVSAYLHRGFWQCMDTLRDKQHLESMWSSGSPRWKVWRE